MQSNSSGQINRRRLFSMIGAAAGATVMYNAMATLGFAAQSKYAGPIKLQGDPKGASVLILGAGVAGMTAALELRDAGYRVQILEYGERAGGRNWSIYGGDRLAEPGLYLNPGPWRIPHHHRALLDYCRRLGVALEPFTQVNYSAYIHSSQHFGGKPQRFREVQADFHGHVAELLAKNTQQGKLDQSVSREDAEMLLEALKQWGALDESYRYRNPCAFHADAARPAAQGGFVANPDERTGIRLAVLHLSACRRHGHDRQGVPKGGR
jgi:monoamine oxidase